VTQAVISHWKNELAVSDDPRHQAVGLALEGAHPDVPDNDPKDTPAKNHLVLLAIETNDPATSSTPFGLPAEVSVPHSKSSLRLRRVASRLREWI
jgi:hypothetical protein